MTLKAGPATCVIVTLVRSMAVKLAQLAWWVLFRARTRSAVVLEVRPIITCMLSRSNPGTFCEMV